MSVILDALPPLKNGDCDFIESTNGKKYIDKIQSELSPSGRREAYLKTLEQESEELQKLFHGMLELNPNKRWTAKQCLESAYFDDVRSISLEKGSKIKLLLDIDQLDAYDYTAR